MNIDIRKAENDDIDLLFEWANSSAVRKNAFSDKPIVFEEHKKWLSGKLSSKKSLILIGSNNAGPVGQVRFDSLEDDHNGVYSIDFHVSPKKTGKGYGKLLLKQSLVHLKQVLGKKFKVKAIVFESNVASQRCFEASDFKLIKKENIRHINCLVYELVVE